MELVEKARNGSNKALITLFNEYRVQMYRTAYVQLHNEHDALDAIQQALEKAFTNIQNLKDNGCFKTWLIRILINECHNIQRYRFKIIPMERELIVKDKPGTQDFTLKTELDDMLQGLDDIYREVIDLRYNHDMKLDDISRTLDIPEGTVKSRLNKAHKLLRNKYFEGEVSV